MVLRSARRGCEPTPHRDTLTSGPACLSRAAPRRTSDAREIRMNGKLCTDDSKIEAFHQVAEHGYATAGVTPWLAGMIGSLGAGW